MSDALWLVLQAVGLSCAGGMAYTAGLGLVPYTAALSLLRLERSGELGRLRMPDAEALTWVARAVSLLLPPLWLVGWEALAVAAAAAALVLVSLRVELEATPAGARLTRRALGLPWWRAVSAAPPDVYLDGWGDFADPLALHVQVGETGLELGWFTRGDDAPQTLARIEAALAESGSGARADAMPRE